MLPDVASAKGLLSEHKLDWVGMDSIQIPVKFAGLSVPAMAAFFVNLDQSKSRGIHMSRLYKIAQEDLVNQELELPTLARVLDSMLQSHQGISSSARIEISLDIFVERKALKSENHGWRTYPVRVFAEKNHNGEVLFGFGTKVTYSSTCPASAALARQLISQELKNKFQLEKYLPMDSVQSWLESENGMIATPHAQRSYANVDIQFGPENAEWTIIKLIDLLEGALGTPVQTIVKREDEQEFARINGQNLMFCEDSARRLQAALLSAVPKLKSFNGEVRHAESLHSHDAICRFSVG